jgi:2-dehydro-3-deoxyphosphogluconate aldolase / (4S)-4-hydroxy-2-oxoglutarate aldolase
MMSLSVEQVMELAPVIPVLVVERVEDALPIAQALVKGGLPALEVTLRTPAALDVIREMAKVEGTVVGAAMEAGARFIVSPGLTEPLGKAAVAARVPFLPGTATAGDIMRGLELGLTHFKFFPAETSGGLPALKALAAPLHVARFCPTGGITAENAPKWLAEPFVKCVGGSWVVPKGPVDGAKIEALAREAAALAR